MRRRPKSGGGASVRIESRPRCKRRGGHSPRPRRGVAIIRRAACIFVLWPQQMSTLYARTVTLTPAAQTLDLNRIVHTQRERLWRQSAQHFFPGLSVRDMPDNPARGSIHGLPIGPGELWNILSPPAQVTYKPRGRNDEGAQWLSVMLQLQGTTNARQDGRSLRPQPSGRLHHRWAAPVRARSR